MHLRQSGLRYSASAPFNKIKERTRQFKETGDSRYIYQNELDKTCFQYDMVHGGFKNDLPRKTTSDKVLRDKTVNIPKNLKYDGYQREIASLAYRCFGKKLLVVVLKVKLFQTNNQLKNYKRQTKANMGGKSY